MSRSRFIWTFATALTCAALAAHASAGQRGENNAAKQDHYVILGCVSRQAGVGRGSSTYLITDTRGEKPVIYRLDGDAATLDFHVGHYVEVAGPLTTSARGAASANARALVMKVERLSYLSKECPPGKPAGK
jgi:hypothetical protein